MPMVETPFGGWPSDVIPRELNFYLEQRGWPCFMAWLGLNGSNASVWIVQRHTNRRHNETAPTLQEAIERIVTYVEANPTPAAPLPREEFGMGKLERLAQRLDRLAAVFDRDDRIEKMMETLSEPLERIADLLEKQFP